MKSVKGFLKLLCVGIIIIAMILPVAVVIHEGTHYLLYTFEGIPITSFHVLDQASFQTGRYGFVTTTKISEYGTVLHEGIATLFGLLFLTSTLLFFLLGPLKPFTIKSLESMGLEKTSRNPKPHGLRQDSPQ